MPDLGVESRWPDFVTRARQLAVGSLLAVQLFVEGDDLAALNMQSPHPHAFTDESEHIARLFAAHAAVALAGAEQRAHLTVALDSRDAIGQAKGILMERHKVTAAQAFDLLVRASSLTNRRLVAVADQLITTGVLPEA
jgi:GAF domain-containing protein